MKVGAFSTPAQLVEQEEAQIAKVTAEGWSTFEQPAFYLPDSATISLCPADVEFQYRAFKQKGIR